MLNKRGQVEQLFIDMCGYRCSSYQEMEDWFRKRMKESLPNLTISECDGINSELAAGETELDYATDCTFGEDMFGMDYADFTIFYIMDNNRRMYVTEVVWS